MSKEATVSFNKESKQLALEIARWSIINYLESGRTNPLPDSFKITDQIKSKTGTFVTVYVNRDLRGCIGTFSESTPLYESIKRLSIQAAFEDHRFKPVGMKDISGLEIEISVLTKRIKVNGPDDVEIGKHGIYLVYDSRKATLLPQVAIEHGFNAVEFLECCAKNKLRMHKDSWKESEIYVYESIILK